MMDLEARRNDALNVNGNFVNGREADITITVRGSNWYWTVCAIMTVSTFIFLGLGHTKPRTHRLFHYITAGITMVAAIAYFTMAANLGFTPIPVEFQRGDSRVAGMNRSIFYVRYVDWVITTPLLLTDLLLTAGMPSQSIFWVVLVDEVMIITGLIGALVESSYKWGYFVFGCVAMFYIFYQLGWEARRHAQSLGNDIGKVFLICGTLTLAVWLLYPIAWGVSEGGNVIAPDSEAVFYGILDIIAKPVFGGLLLWGHRNIDPSRLGLRTRDYHEDPAQSGAIGLEKVPPSNGHSNGHGNGHSDGHTNGHNGVHNGVATTGPAVTGPSTTQPTTVV